MSRSITEVLTSSTTVLLGILTSACLAVLGDAPGERELTQTDGGSSCTRELWRVLFGAGATLVALLVCASPWERCIVHWNGEDQGEKIVSQAFRFVVMLFLTFSPQFCVPWVLTAGYGAILLWQRLKDTSPARWRAGLIAKRLCPMVVWIGIDEATYDSFFGQSSTSVESMAGNNNIRPVTDHEKTTVHEYFKHELHPLRKAPNLKVAVPWPGSKLSPEGDEAQNPYYFCLQGWDRKTIMWKEALVSTEALGTEQNISKWMGMVKVMPWWARALLVVLGLGYEASVLSRFAHHLRVSPLEVMCSWIWLVVVVEAGILPLFVVPSYQGIHLLLDTDQFHKVVQYYITRRTEQHALTCIDLWSFVLCILSMFSLFLILNPPLIYYYYKLPASILSFVSLILFTLLTGASISSFALKLFSPPHHVAFAFTHLCRSPSYLCMLVLTLWLLLTGLASYILALTDTALNWPLFEIEDHSFFSFMIPHIGS